MATLRMLSSRIACHDTRTALPPLKQPGPHYATAARHVVGFERSVREWAQRQGWSGRSVGHARGQEMLVTALEVLTSHFNFRRARPGV